MNRFPRKNPGDGLSAEHINDLGAAVTGLEGTRYGSLTHITGHVRQVSAVPQHVEGLFRIINHNPEDMPNGNELLFIGKFISKNQETGKWTEDASTYYVDISGLMITEETKRYPLLVSGDIINVRYDESSGMMVPTSWPTLRRAVAVDDILVGEVGDVTLVFDGPGDEGRVVELYNEDEVGSKKIDSGDSILIYHSYSLGGWVPLNVPDSGWLLKTTEEITARSGTSLGSGSCIICLRSGAEIVDTEETITAYNLEEESIPSGEYIQAQQWQGVPLVSWKPGGRVVIFELTSGFTSGSATASFFELDGTPIEEGTLLDPTQIVGDELEEEATGLAFKQGSKYVFINARCDQSEEE